MFLIFLISIIISVILNICIVSYFLKREFNQNKLFIKWFHEHNGKIFALLLLLTLTNTTMIPSIFWYVCSKYQLV